MSIRWQLLIAVAVVTLITSAISWYILDRQVNRVVEEEIGSQMVVQAEIAGHLVKVGEARGMSTEQINEELTGISSSVRETGQQQGRALEYEFWITDPTGRAYLRSRTLQEMPADFQFERDHPELQPQARAFFPLLDYDPGTNRRENRPFVIQGAQPREATADTYKYVGVGGVDKPRIVQVGYHASPLFEKIRWDSARTAGIVALVQLLCGSALFYIAFRQVTEPVNRLTQTLHELERTKNYDPKSAERLRPRRDEFGQLARVFDEFAARVVRETRQLETLRAEADQNRKIFLEIDGVGTITDCNEEAVRVFQFSREELVGKHMNQIIPWEAQGEVDVAFKEMRTEEWTDNFNENCTKGGERLWIHWRNRMTEASDESPRTTHSFGTPMTFLTTPLEGKDIHAGEVVRFAEHLLARQAKQLETLREEVDKNRKIFLELDGTGTITNCNEEAVRVFQVSREELVGKHMNSIVPREAQVEVDAAFKEIREEWTDNFNENCTKGGERLWIHWRNRMIQGGAGRSRIVYCFGTPMTFLTTALEGKDIRAAEVIRFTRDLMARQAKQAEAIENLKVFLSSTAHELRDPLHAIRTYANLLSKTELAPMQRYDLRIINGQSLLLQMNIGGLLDSARIARGALELKQEKFSLRSAVEEVISASSVKAVEKNLTLVCRIAPDIPDQLIGDQYRFEQVIGNLVINAIKFTTCGSVRLEITRGPTPGQDRVCLVGRVIDTGAGIPCDKWTTVFEPCEQVAVSGVPNADGLGLGLTICHGLIRAMDGKIDIETSEVARGTVFRFEVLFGLSGDGPDACEPSGPSAASGRAVLLIDRHAERRKALAELLGLWGLRVTEAGTTTEATGALRATPVDLVVIDSATDDRGGLLTAESVRTVPGREPVPVVLLIAATQAPAEQHAGARFGVRAVVHQPATRTEFRAALGAVWRADPPCAPAPDPPTAGQKPLRILVVDDEILHRLGHQRILRGRGHNVALAEDGEQALAAVQREPFDLILLDIRMPRMNGLEVAAKIRAMTLPFEQPRIIALTGNPPREESELRAWRRSGIDRWLEKSLDEVTLFGTITDILEHRLEPTHGGGGSMIDRERLVAKCCGDADQICLCLDMFIHELPGRLVAARSALALGNAYEVEKAIHDGKSALFFAAAVGRLREAAVEALAMCWSSTQHRLPDDPERFLQLLDELEGLHSRALGYATRLKEEFAR